MITAHAHLNRITERRNFDHTDRRARHDAHLHQPPRHRVSTAHRDDARTCTMRQRIQTHHAVLDCRGSFNGAADYEFLDCGAHQGDRADAARLSKDDCSRASLFSPTATEYSGIENRFQFHFKVFRWPFVSGLNRPKNHCWVNGMIERSARTCPMGVVAVTRKGRWRLSALTHRRRFICSPCASSVASASWIAGMC